MKEPEEYHTGKVTKEQIDEIRSRGYGFDITELMTLKNKKRSSLTTNEIERIQYLEESKKDVDKGIEDDIKNVKPSWDYVGVKASDDKTLKVTLKNPTPFSLVFSAIMPLYQFIKKQCWSMEILTIEEVYGLAQEDLFAMVQ